MEHRPPTPDDALKAALAEHDADQVTPSAELTGAQVVGDDVLLELVLPRDAYDALELRLGKRYDLSEVLDDGRHVPVILSSSLALTPAEVDDFQAVATDALRWLGSVSLAVDERADDHPWAVIVTYGDGTVPGSFTTRADTPAEALQRAVALDWDTTPADAL